MEAGMRPSCRVSLYFFFPALPAVQIKPSGGLRHVLTFATALYVRHQQTERSI